MIFGTPHGTYFSFQYHFEPLLHIVRNVQVFLYLVEVVPVQKLHPLVHSMQGNRALARNEAKRLAHLVLKCGFEYANILIDQIRVFPSIVVRQWEMQT